MTDLRITHGDDEKREPFVVDSEAKAAWAVDLILGLRERAARIAAEAAVYVQRAADDAARAETWLLPTLTMWLEANPPRRGRTVHLLTGSIGKRRIPGGPRVRDPEAALAWAQEQLPGAVYVPPAPGPRVVAAVLKDHVERTGEIPPGVEIVDDVDTVEIKARAAEKEKR